MKDLQSNINLLDPQERESRADDDPAIQEIEEESDSLEVTERSDRAAGAESPMDLRALLEKHSDPGPADAGQEQVKPEVPGSRDSDHFKAAMDLLARVAKEVEELESISEDRGDSVFDPDDESLLQEDEDLYEMSPDLVLPTAGETEAPHAASVTNEPDSEPFTGESDIDPESGPMETSSFETRLSVTQAAENGGSSPGDETEIPDEVLDAAGMFDDQPAVLTYEGVSYFLVDEKGRPVLG